MESTKQELVRRQQDASANILLALEEMYRRYGGDLASKDLGALSAVEGALQQTEWMTLDLSSEDV